MNFRRIPFQFTTTDPKERQRELEKRFGIPTRNMYVDSNPGYMTNGMRESSSASSSPRLQHRVPIFVEGSDKPVKPAVDSQNASDGGRKPHVRVIPIEVEGASSPHAARQRTFSGPAGLVRNGLPERELNFPETLSPTKRSVQDLSSPNKIKSPSGPRVCNIPIQIEGRPDIRKPKSPFSPQSPISNSSKISEASRRPNGSCISKRRDDNKVQHEEKPSEHNINVPLKKIENILEEFKMYKIGVENFSGTVKDKQYRYLDEMLTRCMLKLDDIDTMGDEMVRFFSSLLIF
ncbi:BAG domain-containing protein Samui, partial [Stegodyphus mimosarum]